MNANWTVEGWKAQETGASRSDNPHARSSMAFRHWQEGFDQAAAQSSAPVARREPLGLRQEGFDQAAAQSSAPVARREPLGLREANG